MTARIIAYRSRRALSGLGETSASETGNYAAYARALYQAINGDVVGGAYSAAITYAGPIAAIGNAVADYFNKSGDKKSAGTQALYDALAVAPGWTYAPGRVPTLITPTCRALRMDSGARAVSEALRLLKSPEEVGDAMRAWLATSTPWYGPCKGSPTEPVPFTPAPAPAPVITPQPAPVAQTFQPVAPAVMPAIASPDVTVNLPASVSPDQTPLLIQQLLNRGATQQQAMTAALKSLAARGVPATPAVQSRVASDVRASALQINSPAGMILIAVVVLGFTWWVSR